MKIRTYTDRLLQLEYDWQCSHTADIQTLQQKAQQLMKIEWESEPEYGLVLKSVKTQCERSHYLHLANRADTRMIARFRHNRIGHNESMHRMNLGRDGTTPTPNCAKCPASSESIEHMLLHCPAYAAERDMLARYLHSVQLPMTKSVLLAGHLTKADSSTENNILRARTILKHIAAFLRQICTIRQLTII
jgi:hypothetical protein